MVRFLSAKRTGKAVEQVKRPATTSVSFSAEYLREQDYALVSERSDQGTIYVVKVPGRELAGLRSNVPFQIDHELHQHPQAPVIRTIVRIYDQPDRPLAFEHFTNVDSPVHEAEFAQLSEQEEAYFLFYDESLSHQLTKRVRMHNQQEIRNILNYAQRIRRRISDDAFDFDAAKAEVVRGTRL